VCRSDECRQAECRGATFTVAAMADNKLEQVSRFSILTFLLRDLLMFLPPPSLSGILGNFISVSWPWLLDIQGKQNAVIPLRKFA